jgi:hypothetical protein
MEGTEPDTAVLRGLRKFGQQEVQLYRGETPWMKFNSFRGSFSVNGRDYTFKSQYFFMPVFTLIHAGNTIVEMKRREFFSSTYYFDYAGKVWAVKGFRVAKTIECGGQAVGTIKQSGGISFTDKVEASLPKELPDEIQIMLICYWFYWCNANKA